MNLKTGTPTEGRLRVEGTATAEPTTSKGRARMAMGGGGEDLRWSFERIYEDFKTPIVNYIYHLVGNRDQAEDLAHDTFLKAFKALPKMDSSLKLSAWLYRIATNTAYDALRRRKLIGFLPL
ncbi:MAG TPA: sigma-70 family RNA polymerase sigma factor, partial [Ktedonobacterales bacterium]